MDIKVTNLTKKYGPQTAVDNISFEVKTGEVLGFLGPNGAGKSTTMKAITTFLEPTAGRITSYNVCYTKLLRTAHWCCSSVFQCSCFPLLEALRPWDT